MNGGGFFPHLSYIFYILKSISKNQFGLISNSVFRDALVAIRGFPFGKTFSKFCIHFSKWGLRGESPRPPSRRRFLLRFIEKENGSGTKKKYEPPLILHLHLFFKGTSKKPFK